jgi:phosphohistidine phosphatase
MSDQFKGRRRLIIMRHAKSDWEAGSRRDFDRPLNARGQKDAPNMGHWLHEQQLVPQLIISSPSVRTRSTATLVAAQLGIDAGAILWEARVYEATLATLRDVLRVCAAGIPTAMLVGHNPGMESLLKYYTRAETLPPETKAMPTAAVYVLEFPDLLPTDDYREGEGICIAHMRPRWLE